MTASELVNRAKQVADIVNSDFYTFGDATASLGEAYRDLYNQLIDSDDDYFLEESIVAITPAMGTGVPNEYLVPLPADAYKVRYIDYQGNTAWARMDRFAMSSKNNYNGTPRYRINGNNLWIVGQLPNDPTVRIGYYPAPVDVTFPDATISLGATIADYAIASVNRGSWIDSKNTAVYNDATKIVADNKNTGTVSTLRTVAVANNPKVTYYRGYLYWLESGVLYRGTTDLLATVTPVSLVTATVLDFTLFEGFLYYVKGTDTFKCNLDGSGSVVVLASVTTDYHPTAWIAGGTLWVGGVNTTLPASQLAVTDFGVLRFYNGILTNENNDIVAELLDKIGCTVNGNRLLTVGQGLNAWSVVPDTDFTYPSNAVYELLAYQIGMDIMRKAKMDYTLIKDRYGALLMRFITQIRRDEGQPERINNVYRAGGWYQ